MMKSYPSIMADDRLLMNELENGDVLYFKHGIGKMYGMSKEETKEGLDDLVSKGFIEIIDEHHIRLIDDWQYWQDDAN